MRTVMGTPLWSRWNVEHISTHRDGGGGARILAFVRGLLAFVARLATDRPDVVHIHTASYGSFARKSFLTWVARAWRVPVVLHVHGAAFAEFYEAMPRLLQVYVRGTLRAAAAVIALGPTWAQRLETIAPGLRVAVVPNAVQPCEPVDPRGRETVTALFLGRVTEDKGVYALVEAWAEASSSVPQARLVIAGSGEEDRLRRRVEELGVTASVSIAGWQTESQVQALLAASDFLVLPSWWEGQPMAVLEAMARGLPVLASRVGGVPDLLGADAGMLVEPRDVHGLSIALHALLRDAELRARLGSAAETRVRQMYDVNSTWVLIDAIYKEIAGDA